MDPAWILDQDPNMRFDEKADSAYQLWWLTQLKVPLFLLEEGLRLQKFLLGRKERGHKFITNQALQDKSWGWHLHPESWTELHKIHLRLTWFLLDAVLFHPTTVFPRKLSLLRSLLATSVLYSMNTSAFFLSVFSQKLYPALITDTSLQFQILTLCQIPISCCLISIHLLLFLLLLPFSAWGSSSPASSNFLRKAPYWVLLESDLLLYANGSLLFILPNNSCQYYGFPPLFVSLFKYTC